MKQLVVKNFKGGILKMAEIKVRNLDKDTIKKIDELAKKKGLSRNMFLKKQLNLFAYKKDETTITRKKDYMISVNNIEYIQKIKIENGLKFASDALNLIINEHREQERKEENMELQDILELLSEDISERVKNKIKEL